MTFEEPTYVQYFYPLSDFILLLLYFTPLKKYIMNNVVHFIFLFYITARNDHCLEFLKLLLYR